MSPLLLKLIGILIIVVAIWGLIRGRIVAGSRGLRTNYYYKSDRPFLYYSFIVTYVAIGSFILYKTM